MFMSEQSAYFALVLGCEDSGLGIEVLGFGVEVSSSWSRFQGLEYRISALGSLVSGSGLGFRFGKRVYGLESRV